jgi:hypothetical protein
MHLEVGEKGEEGLLVGGREGREEGEVVAGERDEGLDDRTEDLVRGPISHPLEKSQYIVFLEDRWWLENK